MLSYSEGKDAGVLTQRQATKDLRIRQKEHQLFPGQLTMGN